MVALQEGHGASQGKNRDVPIKHHRLALLVFGGIAGLGILLPSMAYLARGQVVFWVGLLLVLAEFLCATSYLEMHSTCMQEPHPSCTGGPDSHVRDGLALVRLVPRTLCQGTKSFSRCLLCLPLSRRMTMNNIKTQKQTQRPTRR
jgi:hypothetical protein